MRAVTGIAPITVALLTGAAYSQQPTLPEPFVQQGQQLAREGRLAEALSLYLIVLKAKPDSVPGHNAAGTVLDLMGDSDGARRHFQKAIDLAPAGPAKASAQRAMAISWAFSGNC